MARKKKQVSPELAIHVYRYFYGNWDNRDRFLKDAETAHRSADDLAQIREMANDQKGRSVALQTWIDNYITPAGVKRMWTALRQRKYHLQNQPILVALAPDVHLGLKCLSKRYKLTISDMVDKLVKEHDTSQEEPVELSTQDERGGVQDRLEITPPVAVDPLAPSILDAVIDLIRAIPGATNEKLVWIPDLRPIVEINLKCAPSVFDSAILALARQDRVILHRHVHAARITAQEREEFVTDGDSWFVGLVLNTELEAYRAFVVGLILKLKDEKGLNYREIADELNAKNLKTFGGKTAWKQAMVSRIYKTKAL